SDLGLSAKPTLNILNKMDAVPAEQREALQVRVQNLMPHPVFVSAVAKHGLDTLQSTLRTAIRNERPLYEIRIPVGNGKMLSDVHRDGEVVEQHHEDDMMVVRARLDERAI